MRWNQSKSQLLRCSYKCCYGEDISILGTLEKNGTQVLLTVTFVSWLDAFWPGLLHDCHHAGSHPLPARSKAFNTKETEICFFVSMAFHPVWVWVFNDEKKPYFVPTPSDPWVLTYPWGCRSFCAILLWPPRYFSLNCNKLVWIVSSSLTRGFW